MAAELRATSSSVFELVIKRAAKRQTARALACLIKACPISGWWMRSRLCLFIPQSPTTPLLLRDRLAELEAEIKRLNSTNIGEANQRIATLENLLEEKKESERRLLTMLSEMKTRLDDQRIMLDRLMKRLDSEAGNQSS
ncbi:MULTISPECIES: hypothetical protein [unclassified Synechococcus]|uniref:hypothetical protein n=1 Tax=unclassified Synechococcus TaxID=2626047 RepID=UPI0012E87969|nr:MULTISPECIES: hypothetical protein [unclassified Synechococcus]